MYRYGQLLRILVILIINCNCWCDALRLTWSGDILDWNPFDRPELASELRWLVHPNRDTISTFCFIGLFQEVIVSPNYEMRCQTTCWLKYCNIIHTWKQVGKTRPNLDFKVGSSVCLKHIKVWDKLMHRCLVTVRPLTRCHHFKVH